MGRRIKFRAVENAGIHARAKLQRFKASNKVKAGEANQSKKEPPSQTGHNDGHVKASE